MKKKSDYTPQETVKFIFERNAKRNADKQAKRNRPVMIHLSKRSADFYEKFNLVSKGVTFYGSIRNRFTGPARNNVVFTN